MKQYYILDPETGKNRFEQGAKRFRATCRNWGIPVRAAKARMKGRFIYPYGGR
jgi:hypothetical protein